MGQKWPIFVVGSFVSHVSRISNDILIVKLVN